MLGRLCVCVMCVLQAQGGVGMLYIVITVLFLPMTAIAEVMVGGGVWRRRWEVAGVEEGVDGKPGDVVRRVFAPTVD